MPEIELTHSQFFSDNEQLGLQPRQIIYELCLIQLGSPLSLSVGPI